jgi:superfamily II DNA or RNA helicase
METTTFFLNPQSVKAMVPAATYERGLAVYLTQMVLDCEVQFSNSREWAINGQVKGSVRTPYSVSAAIEIAPDGRLSYFDGDCSCPVARNCKHAIALVLKAAYRSAKTAQTGPTGKTGLSEGAKTAAKVKPHAAPATPATPQEIEALKALQRQQAQHREQVLADQKLAQWLDQFDLMAAESQTATDVGDVDDRAFRDDQIVFFVVPVREGAERLLHMGFGLSRRLRNGQWAKVKVPRYLDPYAAPKQDLEIVQLIRNMETPGRGYGLASTEHREICGETGRLALQLARASGRLFALSGDRVLGAVMRPGPPKSPDWTWNEVALTSAQESLWALRPAADAAAPGIAYFSNTPPLYLDLERAEFGFVELPNLTPDRVALLLKAPPIPQSAFTSQQTRLLKSLGDLPLPPVVRPLTVVRGVRPSWRLYIAPVRVNDVAQLGLLSATLCFNYAGLDFFSLSRQTPVVLEQPAAHSENSAAGPQASTHLQLFRDLETERRALDELDRLGLAGNARGQFHMPFAQSQTLWPQWADQDFAALREAGFELSIAPSLIHWIRRAEQLDVSLSPQADAAGGVSGSESQSAWFDLSLGMQIDGQRHNILPLIPALLAQLHADMTASGVAITLPPHVFLAQSDGSQLRLPTAPLQPWLQALLDLVNGREQDLDSERLRLSRTEALRVGAVMGDGTHWDGANSLRAMVRQLCGQDNIPEVPKPAGLKAELRPYQQQGLNWLQFLGAHGLGGILADDMGLGKTLQTLAHVLAEKESGRLTRPALIIAPVSLMGNWRREAERFTPGLSVLVLHGAERHDVAAGAGSHDLVIAPYSVLPRDRERWLRQPWHLVVLDEAQNIKNANTHAAQIVGELDTRHRLCLSGTPMENHLGELWSLFHFLMPGFLGSQARFKLLFRTPIEKQGDSERMDQLRRRVTPFMLRRAKQDVATDLPPKQEVVSTVVLEDKQANLYETIRLSTEKTVRETLANKGLAKSQIQILDALLKLRQVCCDPRLVPIAAARKIKQSAKLEMLMDMLPQMLAEGRRILLFSQFTSMLALIESELKARALKWVKLTGQSQKRDALIEQFTSGQVPLFLISLKAGGVGLNLPQADTVIHYDPWWNPAVENQATDRAHRIGQTQSVFVYKMVAQGTIEERILALQSRKAALAESLYSGSTGRKQALFTEADVAELLRPLGG